jgi:phosphoadenosine phosphosulfate reductase
MSVAALSLAQDLTDRELAELSAEFEGCSPEAVLRWALDEFDTDVALATGFGAEGCVLVHMLANIRRDARIFYLDTDLLFPETYELRNELANRYGVRFERRTSKLTLREQAREYGDRLWETQPDLCCKLRKVALLEEMFSDLNAWITAIRRDQTPARANAGIIERDKKFGLIKINPLATWSSIHVWNYIAKHDVPFNPLYRAGYSYSSIGCGPCTSPVNSGEDPRAGRWRGSAKTECGLHR